MSDETKERKPWDQQEGEPNDSYSHFLAYRNLGAGRSIDAAYVEVMAASGSRRNRASPPKNASGAWGRESAKWAWPDRAIAWDIAMLEAHGREIVTIYFAALRKAALKVLVALDDKKVRPMGWNAVIDGLHELASVIPPETVAALRSHAGVAWDEAGDGGKDGSAWKPDVATIA